MTAQDKSKKIKDKKKTIVSFAFCLLSSRKEGISLLLVVVLLSALFSISIGIFNLTLGQFLISGEIADSFVALYASDHAIERVLYKDRVAQTVCPTRGNHCYEEGEDDDPIIVPLAGCHYITVSKTGSMTTITSIGWNRCEANAQRVIKRGLQVTY